MIYQTTANKKKHIIETKTPPEYQKMLNQWETTGINYTIIKEDFTVGKSGGNLVLFHIIKDK